VSSLNPQRTIDELKELRTLTSDENGAQRVAFTATWAKARSCLETKARELGAEVKRDAAGNLWMTLRGKSEKALLIGGHIDSVPNGGWLDGSLNTLAGLENSAPPGRFSFYKSRPVYSPPNEFAVFASGRNRHAQFSTHDSCRVFWAFPETPSK
jgi:hypothetical protein